jgi:hypothetical protein
MSVTVCILHKILLEDWSKEVWWMGYISENAWARQETNIDDKTWRERTTWNTRT